MPAILEVFCLSRMMVDWIQWLRPFLRRKCVVVTAALLWPKSEVHLKIARLLIL